MARERKRWRDLPKSTQSYYRNRDVSPRRYEAERRRSPGTRRLLDRLGISRNARLRTPGSPRDRSSSLGRAVGRIRQQRGTDERLARQTARARGQAFTRQDQAELDRLRRRMRGHQPGRPGRPSDAQLAFMQFLHRTGRVERPEQAEGS